MKFQPVIPASRASALGKRGKRGKKRRLREKSRERVRGLTGDHGVLQIVLGRAGLADLWEVFELTAAQLELAAQVRLLQDPFEAPGELLLYVTAHVRRNHRHITFFGHGHTRHGPHVKRPRRCAATATGGTEAATAAAASLM